MPTVQVFTRVQDLTPNANGDITVLTQHHDESLDRLMDQVEGLATSVFSKGGVLAVGTVAIESSATIRVQNRSGLVDGATAFVSCGDQSVDMSALADGIKYRAVITAAIQVTNAYTFTDPDTGESLTHNLVAYLGRLEVLTGDASNHPALPANALDVATLTKAAGVVTIDANQDAVPIVRSNAKSYDLELGFVGNPAPSAFDWMLIGRSITIDHTDPGEAHALTNPADGDWVASILVNGTSVGTVTLSTTGAVTWSITNDVSLIAGDRISLSAPATADSAAADIQVLLRGWVY